jgi:hypothetical protein
MRRQAAAIAHQMHARQRHERRELLQEFQWREFDPSRPIRPRAGEGVEQVTVGVVLQALQRHGAPGRIADQPFELIAAVRRNLVARVVPCCTAWFT